MDGSLGNLTIKFTASDENVSQVIDQIIATIGSMQSKFDKALNKPLQDMTKSSNKMSSTIASGMNQMNNSISKSANSFSLGAKKIKSNMEDIGKSTKGLNSSVGGFMSSLKGIAKFTAFSFLGRQIVNVGAKIFELGSDMAEVENLFQVSFRNMSGEADAFAQRLQDAWGVDTTPIKEQTAYLNQMFKSMNFGTQTAYNMSTELEKLSYNMSSLYNISQKDAFEKLRSGIAGQIRPLKSLGVLIDDTTIKQYALNAGIWDGEGVMNQQQKTLAR